MNLGETEAWAKRGPSLRRAGGFPAWKWEGHVFVTVFIPLLQVTSDPVFPIHSYFLERTLGPSSVGYPKTNEEENRNTEGGVGKKGVLGGWK